MQSIFNPLSLYKIDSKIDRGGDREWYLGTIPSNLFIFQVKNENMFISHTLSVFIVSSTNIFCKYSFAIIFENVQYLRLTNWCLTE